LKETKKTIEDVRLIDLPKIPDPRGNLSFIEEYEHIPFKIERTYWIYDVPGGQIRGGHAFKEQQELVVALSGSFDVIIKDGLAQKRFHLNRSYFGLLIPNGLWREMDNFSTNSVVLVLSSTKYDEKDYMRNFDEFLNWQYY
jgi:dTDP-4-dehydrorhamnose 3,5-epimerase-like enzyme